MKVFILVEGEAHEGYNIVGVYSTKELAEAAKAKEPQYSTNSCMYHDIEEFEVDETTTT